jgi:glutamate/tyrosine decarboxylase-like PLP-dependent enzyme
VQWAGVALALPEQRENLRLNELNDHADSFCTNMHKWGLTNFDCSLLYVRERKDLTSALDVTPAYLRTKEGEAGMSLLYTCASRLMVLQGPLSITATGSWRWAVDSVVCSCGSS